MRAHTHTPARLFGDLLDRPPQKERNIKELLLLLNIGVPIYFSGGQQRHKVKHDKEHFAPREKERSVEICLRQTGKKKKKKKPGK